MSFILYFALLFFTRAFAASMFPFIVTFDNQFKPALVQYIQPQLETALIMVARYPPRHLKRPVFSWEKVAVGVRTVTLDFVGQPTPFQGARTQELQAVTSSRGLPWMMDIRVHLLMDRIFFDPSGSLRPDGYIQLTVALASQLFGPAHLLWQGLGDHLYNQQIWADMQRESHRAGVNFIRRVLSRPDRSLPSEVTQSLRTILARERKLVRKWETVHCEDVFNRCTI